jgi:hypothetical protein
MQSFDEQGHRRVAFTEDEERADDRTSWSWVVFGPPFNPWVFRGTFTLFDVIRVALTLAGAATGAALLWRFGAGWSGVGAVVGAWAWRPLLLVPVALLLRAVDRAGRSTD